jgi:hypothetical protein
MADISSSSGPSPALRASDADRERVAAALRRHHLDGRLDTDELQERLGACYAAKTQDELAPLLADLPGEGPRRPPRSARAGASWRGPRVPLAALVLVALALATAAAIAHGRPGPLPLLLVFLFLRLGRGGGARRGTTVSSARG